MTSRNSRSEYERRMHRVVAHIDEHLDQPLDLQTLAEVAHFSPFHFHRLFSAWMGETLGDYLRRRRLEIAVMRLAAQKHGGNHECEANRPAAGDRRLSSAPRLDRSRYGISHDDPSITAPEQCRYDACAEVEPDFVASGGAFKTTIPGGRYAVLASKGGVEEVGEAWTA